MRANLDDFSPREIVYLETRIKSLPQEEMQVFKVLLKRCEEDSTVYAVKDTIIQNLLDKGILEQGHYFSRGIFNYKLLPECMTLMHKLKQPKKEQYAQ